MCGEAKRKELTKEEAFKENPDMFIDLSELLIGLTSKGLLVNPGASRGHLINAMYDLNRQFDYYVMSMDREAKKEGKIITPDNGKSRIGDIT